MILFLRARLTRWNIKNLDIITMLLKAGLTLQPHEIQQFHHLAALSWTSRDDTRESDVRSHLISFLAAVKELSSSSAAAAEIYPYVFDLITSMEAESLTLTHDSSPVSIDSELLKDPSTSALLAAQCDDDGKLQYLLDNRKMDLNLNGRVNSQGDTILHIAAKNGATKSVRLLLQHGSDPLTPNLAGGLPLWLCTTTDAHSTILSILLDYDPSQGSIRNSKGDTFWHIVADFSIRTRRT